MAKSLTLWHECYFGGSFNPIHLGHIEAALEAKRALNMPVTLIPAGNPPHKKALIPFHHRLTMCQLVAQQYNLKVSNVEEGTKLTPTINTLRNLVPNFNDYLVPFLVGTDSIESLPTWIEPDALRKNVLWVVAPRSNNNLPDDLHVITLNTPIRAISSTMIRQLIQNKKDLTPYLSQNVIDYINQLRLYHE